jgi:hypothetical protein
MNIFLDHALEVARSYESLCINNVVVRVPYFINSMTAGIKEIIISEVDDHALQRRIFDSLKSEAFVYGANGGKANPKEIIKKLELAVEDLGISHETISATGYLEIMKLYGLGVDCSGFVYNIIRIAAENTGLLSNLNILFSQNGVSSDPRKVSCDVLAKVLCNPCDFKDLCAGDLIFLSSKSTYTHVGILLQEHEGGALKFWQSSLMTDPVGVTGSNFQIINGNPVFHFSKTMGTDWDQLFKLGRLHAFKLKDGLFEVGGR